MPSIWIVATRAAKLCQECSMGRVGPNAGRNEPSDTYDRPAWRWVGGLTAGSMYWASWRSFSGGTGLAEGCPQVWLPRYASLSVMSGTVALPRGLGVARTASACCGLGASLRFGTLRLARTVRGWTRHVANSRWRGHI